MQIRFIPKEVGVSVGFYEQWSALFNPKLFSWVDFSLVHFYVEWAKYAGRFEIELGLLGLNLTVTYVYDNTFAKGLESMSDVITEELKARTGATEVLDPYNQLSKFEEKE